MAEDGDNMGHHWPGGPGESNLAIIILWVKLGMVGFGYSYSHGTHLDHVLPKEMIHCEWWFFHTYTTQLFMGDMQETCRLVNCRGGGKCRIYIYIYIFMFFFEQVKDLSWLHVWTGNDQWLAFWIVLATTRLPWTPRSRGSKHPAPAPKCLVLSRSVSESGRVPNSSDQVWYPKVAFENGFISKWIHPMLGKLNSQRAAGFPYHVIPPWLLQIAARSICSIPQGTLNGPTPPTWNAHWLT